MCQVFEIIVPFNWQVSKTTTTQGRAAEGDITDETRLFHSCASKMVHTRGRLALRRENDKTILVCCFMRGDRELDGRRGCPFPLSSAFPTV